MLRPLASVVERGLLRSSMSRSGILGGEISPSVPLLDRIEKMLEQRVTESALSNYDGWIDVVARPIAAGQWQLAVSLRSFGDPSGEEPVVSERISVVGGDDRDAVLFNVSVVSKAYVPSPPMLSISTPQEGRSEAGRVFLEAADDDQRLVGAAPVEEAVLVEVGQGTKILTALRVPLSG